MSKHQIPKRIRNNADHISSSIMVLQSNTITLGKLVIKCPPQALGGFVKDFHKSSLGFRGHLITNFPNVMVLLIKQVVSTNVRCSKQFGYGHHPLTKFGCMGKYYTTVISVFEVNVKEREGSSQNFYLHFTNHEEQNIIFTIVGNNKNISQYS